MLQDYWAEGAMFIVRIVFNIFGAEGGILYAPCQ